MSRYEAYQEWMDRLTYKQIRLQCLKCSEEMAKEFPELIVKKGMVKLDLRGTLDEPFRKHSWEPHAWCETDDGDIIDPTEKQWGVPIVEYKEGAPRGKCIHCGELSYYDPHFCSKSCLRENQDLMECRRNKIIE